MLFLFEFVFFLYLRNNQINNKLMKNLLKIIVFFAVCLVVFSACTDPEEQNLNYRSKYIGIYDFTVYRQLYQLYNNGTTTYDTMYYRGVVNFYNSSDDYNDFFPSITPIERADSALTIYFLTDTHITTEIDGNGVFKMKTDPTASHQTGNYNDNGTINITVDFWPSLAHHDTYTIVGVKR